MSQSPTIDEAEPQPSLTEEQLAALRELIEERMRGEFVDMKEGCARTEAMLAAKRKKYGL